MIRHLITLCCCTAFFTAAAQSLPALVPYYDGRQWGYADTAGHIKIRPQWASAVLFKDNKAIVTIADTLQGQPVSCLINTAGQYIIAPEAGWTGVWSGWSSTGLNARNRQGKMGLVDTAGNISIPYEYDGSGYDVLYALKDAFKVVIKNGRQGVVNRKGELVVPCKWYDIVSDERLASIGAIKVKDPDNAGGYNAYGLVRLKDNKLMLPPLYYDIGYLPLSTGPVFSVSVAAANQVPSYIQNKIQYKYLSFATGQEVFPSDAVLQHPLSEEYKTPYGPILFGENKGGLMDSNRRIIIPCCHEISISQDTIYVHDYKKISKDSARSTRQYLDARTLKPLAPPKETILYTEEEERNTGFYSQGYSRSWNRDREPEISIDGYSARQFYKDSLLMTVSEVLEEDKLYVVTGYAYHRAFNRVYYRAVIDHNLHYRTPVSSHYEILDYNKYDGLATVSPSGGSLYGLIDGSGAVRLAPQKSKLGKGFMYKGKAYAFLSGNEGKIPGYGFVKETIKGLIDSSGEPVPGFAGYPFIYPPSGASLQEGSIKVQDSAGHIGFLSAGGVSLYPEINFKYTALDNIGGRWFLAGDADKGTRSLRDRNGKILLPDIDITGMESALPPRGAVYIPGQNSGRLPDTELPARLYLVRGRDMRTGQPVSFYLDDNARAYYRSN